MLRFANPSFVLRFAARAVPIFGALAAILIAVGLYLVFFVAPADYQQGETVRIMYIHVPAAWLGLFAYMVMASAGARHAASGAIPLADAAQKSAAPLGAMFTFVCLVTGSLWGKPMWGTYWVWDARLTSMLVLLLIYLGADRAVEHDRGAATRRARPPPS
ncbi:MAG: cytochrome c biogenesis protein CcsA [Rhodoblastus sp.]